MFINYVKIALAGATLATLLAWPDAGDSAGSDHLATDQLAEAMTGLYYSR